MSHLLDILMDSTPVCVTVGSCLCRTCWILSWIVHLCVLLKDLVHVTPIGFCYGYHTYVCYYSILFMSHLLDFVMDNTLVCVTKGSCLYHTCWVLLS